MDPQRGLRRMNANKEIFDSLIKKCNKDWSLSFRSSSKQKVYNDFIKDSDLLIKGMESDIQLTMNSMNELLQEVKKTRDDLKEKLYKKIQKLDPLTYFESQLDSFISKKCYKEDDVRKLTKIFEKNKNAFKELSKDPTRKKIYCANCYKPMEYLLEEP